MNSHGPLQAVESKNSRSTFVLELILYAFLAYVFYLSANQFKDEQSLFRVRSVILFFFHTMFLYLHEGGHFLFSLFGRTLYILGGSFWQVMFPLLAFLFALRDRSRIAPLPLFLTGFSLMDVSIYVRDAPLRRLPLITRDKSGHDWSNLLRGWGMLDSAETFADITYALGFLFGLSAVLAGFYLAVRTQFKPQAVAGVDMQAAVDERIRLKEESTGQRSAPTSEIP